MVKKICNNSITCCNTNNKLVWGVSRSGTFTIKLTTWLKNNSQFGKTSPFKESVEAEYSPKSQNVYLDVDS